MPARLSGRRAALCRCGACGGATFQCDAFVRLPKILAIRVQRDHVAAATDAAAAAVAGDHDSPLAFTETLELRELVLFPEQPLAYDGQPCSTQYELHAVCFYQPPQPRTAPAAAVTADQRCVRLPLVWGSSGRGTHLVRKSDMFAHFAGAFWQTTAVTSVRWCATCTPKGALAA